MTMSYGLDNRRRVWRQRLGTPGANPLVAVADDGARILETIQLQDPAGGQAPNCRYVWADARELL